MNKSSFLLFWLVACILQATSPLKTEPLKTHTIYISGPSISGCFDKKWLKESKALYKGIKDGVELSGNTIELFPKRSYRDSIIKNKRRGKKKLLSTKDIVSMYSKREELVLDLINLILKRREEILVLNRDGDIYDERIHLRSHGKGIELLELLKNSKYREFIGSLISFEGDPESYDEYESSSYEYIEDSYEVEEELRRTLSLYLHKAKKYNISEDGLSFFIDKIKNDSSRGIININWEDISDDIWEPGQTCTLKKGIVTVGAIVSIISAILALF